MRRGRLRTTLHQIIALTMPAAIGAGCGIDRTSFAPVACADTEATLTGLSLADPADSLTLRSWDSFDPTTVQVIAELGTPCVNATDPEACTTTITSPPTQGFVLGEVVDDLLPEHDIVVTRGDDVEFVRSRRGLQDLVGPVDTPHEAVMWVASSGRSVECGTSADDTTVRTVAGGHEVLVSDVIQSCGPVEIKRFQLLVSTDGTITEVASETILYDAFSCIGRRPSGLIDGGPCAKHSLGAFWAGIAHLEAASIRAFATLCRELVHHGAPNTLVKRAHRALRDEVRHARLTGDLARFHGAAPKRPMVQREPVRSLAEIAVENATEGCVRETFGALIGLWQGKRATDARTRTVMQSVADDEVEHAELAWAVHRWLWPRLTQSERQRVQFAQQRALAELSLVATSGPGPTLNAVVGWPSASDAALLLQGFIRSFQPLAV
jgi:hypothetical protein